MNNNKLSGCFSAELSPLCGKEVYVFNNPGLPGGGNFYDFCTAGIGSCSPSSVPNANQVATVGTAFAYTVNAFTDDQTPNSLTYTATIALANGLSFDAVSRIISGTPTTAGVSRVTITATDPDGQSANTTFFIIAVTNCPDSPDYAALVNLYAATNGPNWLRKDNWLTNCTPCNWYGVECDVNNRVSALNLASNQLIGNLPVGLNALTNLESLNLQYNQLSGSIPTTLGDLSKLKSIYLRTNQLSGSIPTSLSALSNLESLSLDNNRLSESIPVGLGKLINLQLLRLDNNQLSGSIPSSLGSLPALGALFLQNNDLSGCFPASLSALCGKSVMTFGNPGLPNNGDFNQFCISGDGICPNAMPVNLVSFSATAINEHAIKLDWITASEQNNDYFLIERSKDLIHIEPLTTTKAHEGTSFQSAAYMYTDEKPYTGTSYYRLRQVDNNGSITIYPWKSVVIRKQAYGVFPNPISHQRFSLQLDEPLTAIINLYTVDGRPLPFQKISNEAGSLQLATEGKLPTGIYILTVEERAQTRQYRLVVD